MKPERVRKAQINEDHNTLSELGAAGALASLKRRQEKVTRAKDEALAEEIRLEEEMLERAIEANEHIVPIDSDEELDK